MSYEENIKKNYNVKINQSTYEKLKEDKEIFRIKSFNQLINKIFYSYLKSNGENDIYKSIEEKISASKLSKILEGKELEDLKEMINKSIYSDLDLDKKNNKQLNFRLDKENEDLSLIKAYENNDQYNSIFFRRIFEWYSLKPKYKREQLLNYDMMKIVKKAIDSNFKIRVTIKKGDQGSFNFDAIPYSIIVPQEENYTYILTTNDEDKIYTTRISNIEKLIVIPKKTKFSKEVKQKLDEKVKNKNITPGELENIKIKLTENGYKLYKRIVHLRPKDIKKEEYRKNSHYEYKPKFIEQNGEIFYVLEVYTTINKAKNYFVQLGEECEVLEPKELRSDMIIFFKNAIDIYK